MYEETDLGQGLQPGRWGAQGVRVSPEHLSQIAVGHVLEDHPGIVIGVAQHYPDQREDVVVTKGRHYVDLAHKVLLGLAARAVLQHLDRHDFLAILADQLTCYKSDVK